MIISGWFRENASICIGSSFLKLLRLKVIIQSIGLNMLVGAVQIKSLGRSLMIGGKITGGNCSQSRIKEMIPFI